jgi:hypothetical protein
VIALEVADLVIIAGRTLGLDTHEVLDLLDPQAAARALDLARADLDPCDEAGSAAALLRALVRERPLRSGNEQVALVAMLQFLALNGCDTELGPPGQVREWWPISRRARSTRQKSRPGSLRDYGCCCASAVRLW